MLLRVYVQMYLRKLKLKFCHVLPSAPEHIRRGKSTKCIFDRYFFVYHLNPNIFIWTIYHFTIKGRGKQSHCKDPHIVVKQYTDIVVHEGFALTFSFFARFRNCIGIVHVPTTYYTRVHSYKGTLHRTYFYTCLNQMYDVHSIVHTIAIVWVVQRIINVSDISLLLCIQPAWTNESNQTGTRMDYTISFIFLDEKRHVECRISQYILNPSSIPLPSSPYQDFYHKTRRKLRNSYR